jgi:hypothetical protein
MIGVVIGWETDAIRRDLVGRHWQRIARSIFDNNQAILLIANTCSRDVA